MAHENEIRVIAQRLINKHGDLVEVRCVSGNNPCQIELEFADGEQKVIGEHSGGIDISLIEAGYHCTGSKCFHAFLDTAGYNVTFDQIVQMKDGTVLRKEN